MSEQDTRSGQTLCLTDTAWLGPAVRPC